MKSKCEEIPPCWKSSTIKIKMALLHIFYAEGGLHSSEAGSVHTSPATWVYKYLYVDFKWSATIDFRVLHFTSSWQKLPALVWGVACRGNIALEQLWFQESWYYKDPAFLFSFSFSSIFFSLSFFFSCLLKISRFISYKANAYLASHMQYLQKYLAHWLVYRLECVYWNHGVWYFYCGKFSLQWLQKCMYNICICCSNHFH